MKEFHDMIQLRIEVFVVEQDCPYQELDGKDESCYHVLGFNENNEIVATTRLVPPGISYNIPSIGRVVVKETYRALKLGHQLMVESIKASEELFPTQSIKISAQEHLERFYNAHGFVKCSDSYLEDGIPHIAMIKE